jgi:drug/metabolite transporter (DMT)-like permease
MKIDLYKYSSITLCNVISFFQFLSIKIKLYKFISKENPMKSIPNQQIKLSGFLITLLGAILFSTKAIFIKLAFASTKVDAVTLLSLRMLVALPFYIVAAIMSYRKPTNQPISKVQWMNIFLLGLLGYYISSLCDFIGLQFISAGLERLILFMYPTLAILINTFVFKTKLSKTQLAALVLTYLGIGIAYFGEMKIDTNNPNFYYGSFMVFLCAVTYSVYIVGTGKLVPKVGVTRFTANAMLAATAGIFIHFILSRSTHQIDYSNSLLFYSLALGIVATVLPSFMISNGMKTIGINNVAVITSIGPVSTILQAHFVLHEPIFTEQLIGTILVIIGVLLIGRKAAIENS